MKKTFFALLGAVLLSVPLTGQTYPQVMGHRGCHDGETATYENTMASLRRGCEAGLAGMEFDVHITPDDSLVVLHGPKVPGTDKEIRKLKYKQVRTLRLPGGHAIPTLREWLIEARKYPSVKLFLEMKAQLNEGAEKRMVAAILDLVHKLGMEKQMVYLSFRRPLCEEVLRREPGAEVWLITSSTHSPSPAELKPLGYSGISYGVQALVNRPWLIEELHAQGMKACIWQVNERDLYLWAAKKGCDWITSDIPDRAKAFRDACINYYRRKPDTPLRPGKRALPHLMAHRGFSGADGVYENSIYALKKAQEMGLESVEFDVQLTADDSLVIYHGPFIKGTQRDIKTMTFAEVRAVPTPEGLGPIPTLREYLTQVRKYPSVKMYLEMKRQLNEERQCVLARKVVDLCDEMGVTPQMVFISGWRHLCEQVLRLRPGAPVWLIAIAPHATTPEEIAELKSLGYTGVTYTYTMVMSRPWLLDCLRANGMETCVYHADNAAALEWAEDHGCDWYTTNVPKQSRDYLDAADRYVFKP